MAGPPLIPKPLDGFPSEEGEEELFEEGIQGDEDLYFIKLIASHRSALVRIWYRILRRTPNEQDAEDVVQDFFIDLLEFVRRTFGKKKILYPARVFSKIASAKIASFYRNRKNNDTEFVSDSELALSESRAQAIEQELDERIEEALQILGDERRSIVNMRVFQELSHREIAKKNKISVRNSRQILHRAFKDLRARLSRTEIHRKEIPP